MFPSEQRWEFREGDLTKKIIFVSLFQTENRHRPGTSVCRYVAIIYTDCPFLTEGKTEAEALLWESWPAMPVFALGTFVFSQEHRFFMSWAPYSLEARRVTLRWTERSLTAVQFPFHCKNLDVDPYTTPGPRDEYFHTFQAKTLFFSWCKTRLCKIRKKHINGIYVSDVFINTKLTYWYLLQSIVWKKCFFVLFSFLIYLKRLLFCPW